MNWGNNFEQFLNQLSDWQRETFSSWTNNVPNMQSFNSVNFNENLAKTVRFQEEVVTSSLEFQALLARMSIETQKQFWENYFNTLRKTQGNKTE